MPAKILSEILESWQVCLLPPLNLPLLSSPSVPAPSASCPLLLPLSIAHFLLLSLYISLLFPSRFPFPLSLTMRRCECGLIRYRADLMPQSPLSGAALAVVCAAGARRLNDTHLALRLYGCQPRYVPVTGADTASTSAQIQGQIRGSESAGPIMQSLGT